MSNRSGIKYTRTSFRLFHKRRYTDIQCHENRYYTCLWIGCEWDQCDFYRVGYYHGCRFFSCVFRNCTFRGRHTYLRASFKNCQFIDCKFTEVSFCEASLTDCRINGTLVNVLFYGDEAPRHWQTRFKRVDLSGTNLVDADFRLGLKKEDVKA
jgi:uncharacterized protein YjbI with pentapeptide repeats